MSDAVAESNPAQNAAPAKISNPWLPVIAVIAIMPAISFAMTQYVLIPKIKAAVAEKEIKSATTAGADGKAGDKSGDKKGDAKNPAFSYDFENIVVNLSGAGGTRYLKASFT